MRWFLLIFIFISLLSCSNNVTQGTLLEPKEELKQILDSFIRENSHKNFTIYELYIDKIDPFNTDMILYAGNMSLTEEENYYTNQTSLLSFVYQDVKINIYSGVERYFNNTSNNMENYVKSKYTQSALLAIIDSFGVLRTRKLDSGYPFIPFPLENKDGMFAIPVLTEPDEE